MIKNRVKLELFLNVEGLRVYSQKVQGLFSKVASEPVRPI